MEPRTSKLPLWATVKSAYCLAWGNRMEYIKISCWWLMLAMPIVYLYNGLIWTSLQPSLCFATIKANSEQQNIAPAHDIVFLTLPATFFMLLFGASIAVAWHRLILRNEHITTDRYLRVDNVVWSYFVCGVFLWFISALPAFFMSGIDHQASPGTHIIKGTEKIVVGIATLLITIRLSVILPAKALALTEVTIKNVWERTRWNFWRLFIGTILCALPVVPITMIIQPGCYNDLTGVTLYTLENFLYVIIVLPIELTFLSLSYQHFFGNDKML